MTTDPPSTLPARPASAGLPADAVARGRVPRARRPAERRAPHAKAELAYAVVDAPVGPLLAVAGPSGLVRIAFSNGDAPQTAFAWLAERPAQGVVEAPARLDAVRRQLDEYFSGRRCVFDLALDPAPVRGIGRRVLDATARIPYGAVETYRTVAARVGSPRGMRAVGNALAANPLPIVVPCHRVVRSSGGLGGYAGGIERKRFLLELEGGGSPAV